MILWKLVMIKIAKLWMMLMPHVHDTALGVGQVLWGRFTALDGNRVQSKQQAASKEFVLVGASGVSENLGDRTHETPVSELS